MDFSHLKIDAPLSKEEFRKRLLSDVPGVTVTITPNPLQARIELTPAALRELTYRQVIDDLLMYNGMAHYALTEKKSNVDDARRWLDTIYKRHDEAYKVSKDKKTFAFYRYFSRAETSLLDDVNEPHVGDCTAVACSCTRCMIEDKLQINTFPYGKWTGSAIAAIHYTKIATDKEKREREERNPKWKYFVELTPEQKADEERRHEQAMLIYNLYQEMAAEGLSVTSVEPSVESP